jgi:hypothetical protein
MPPPDHRDALLAHLASLEAHLQWLSTELDACEQQRIALFADLHRPRSASVPQDDPRDVPTPAPVLEAPAGLLGACLNLLQRFVDLNDGIQDEGYRFFAACDAYAEDCRALLAQTDGVPRQEDASIRHHVVPHGST